MIQEEYGKYILSCNRCDELVILNDFSEAVRYAKEFWKTVKDGDDYRHYCEDCKEKL